jgi:hypothetical protein
VGRSFSSDIIGPQAVGGFKPLKLQGLKAPLEGLAIVGPEGPTPYLKIHSAKLGHDHFVQTLDNLRRGIVAYNVPIVV